MVFSSNLFLFLFLPVCLLFYFIVPARFRNAYLFLASILFYYWSSGRTTWILLFSIFSNYYLSRLMRAKFAFSAKIVMVFGVALNLSMLIYFKYANFFVAQLNALLSSLGRPPVVFSRISLPVGISFFTFLAISYLIDVYHGLVNPPDSVIDFGFYKSFFPQLIAGPIVRYVEISKEIAKRKPSADMLFQGVYRFSTGLGKKVLVADRLGPVADHMFALSQNDLTPGLAWLGIACYTLQIYFDFSGYSDMAIGLGHVFGFHFPENFDQPYRSQNITEFWQRWHMTLSRWFRDYLYIPLGGNRDGALRTYFNLTLVFLLCGLWHGAGWPFITWGAYYGVLLVVERILATKAGFRPSGPAGLALTLLLVMIGWVFFRSETVPGALQYLAAMGGWGAGRAGFFHVTHYLTRDVQFFMIAGIILSVFPFEKFEGSPLMTEKETWLKASTALALLFLSAASISVQGFTPFIYFRF